MTTALALCLAAAGLDGVSAQAAGQAVPGTTPAATAPAERSDDELWNELKALSGSPVEDGLWEAAEAATEHVFGSALERETGEKVFETIAAALERDWRGAAQLAGPEILSAYLPGVGQYIELVQSAAQQIDRVTDEWAAQLYDHDSYRWVEEQVAAEYTRLRAPMVDQLNEPFYGYIDDDSYAFMPSYALPVGSQAQIRARAFEAQLFERFMQQPFMDELTATDYTSNGGGVGSIPGPIRRWCARSWAMSPSRGGCSIISTTAPRGRISRPISTCTNMSRPSICAAGRASAGRR